MADNKYIVSKSNYTLRKKHKTLPKYDIYVRDYMTTTDPSSWKSGVFSYGDSNFKFTRRTEVNGKRKHNYGEWKKQTECVDDTNDGSVWTLDCISNDNTTENNIVIKPNNIEMLDLSYYGSATQLIKGTLQKSIQKFPAELYFTDKTIEYYENDVDNLRFIGYNIETEIENAVESDVYDDIVKTLTDDIYEVSNPFGIDVVNIKNVFKDGETYNPYRYFSLSVDKYVIKKNIDDLDENNPCVDDWQVLYKEKGCYDGQMTAIIKIREGMYLFQYYFNKKYYLLVSGLFSGYRIRLKQEYIDEFFDSLTVQESVFLNRYTNPIYTCTIKKYEDTPTGTVYYNKKFTFPTSYGWNLNITSNVYETYVNDLLELSEYVDENYGNNLIRMITHESIKNMDLTYKRLGGEELEDDFSDGTTKFENLLYLIGNFFDDIKLYIDSISYENSITYDGNGNLPNYFLSDSLENSGWDVYSAVNGLETVTTHSDLYEGLDKAYTTNEANIQFMTNIKLNSKSILSRKGTKESIEMLLSLFGFRSYEMAKGRFGKDNIEEFVDYDYTLDEYVCVAENYSGLTSDVETTCKYKTNYDYDDDNEPLDTIVGLPVIYTYDTTGENRYIIPWFDELREIDGEPYFQMYGGWGKTNRKDIYLNLTTKDYIESTTDFSIHDETIQYINIVRNLYDLSIVRYEKLYDEAIYYVYDVTDYNAYFVNQDPISDDDINKLSHYFILKDKEYSSSFADTLIAEDEDGNVTETYRGWYAISSEDIEDGKNDGLKVLYLESIVDDSKSNNPHVGYSKYDDGSSYLEKFSDMFKYNRDNYAFSDGAYACETGDLIDECAKHIGFTNLFNEDGTINYVKDNVKCWYYIDMVYYDTITTEGSVKNDLVIYKKTDEGKELDTPIHVGVKNTDMSYECDAEPFNLENGEFKTSEENIENDEASANSVINTKKIKLTFFVKYEYRDNEPAFIYKSVLPYVKQMIPSTTIFEVEYKTYEMSEVKEATIAGVGFVEDTE